jgi:DNA-binding MarR family transcriptional regulator
MEPITVDAYVLDVLMRDLVAHDKHPSAFLVYLHLWRRAADVKGAVFVSYQMIADATGLSKSAVQDAIAALERRKLVRVQRKSPTATPGYTLLHHWRK